MGFFEGMPIIYRQKKSERLKKPKYCEAQGGVPRLKLKTYRPKGKERKDPAMKGVRHERCKRKPYKLVKVTSCLLPGDSHNPNPEGSGRWVRYIRWVWFCEDCHMGWSHGAYVLGCPKCKCKFYYSYDNINDDHAEWDELSCPYCRTKLTKWKKLKGGKEQRYELTEKGWRKTGEFKMEVVYPKSLTCKKCKRKMDKVSNIKRKKWKVNGWRCGKCGLEVPYDDVVREAESE